MRIRPLAADALVAAAPTGVALLIGQEAVDQGWPQLDPVAYGLVGLVNLPLLLRTRAPVAVCLVVHAAWIGYVTVGYWPVVNSFGPMLAVYTVASLRPLRIAAACTALMSTVWIYAGLLSPHASMPSVVGQAVGFALVLLRFGVLARRSGELTRQLRRENEERARREVAEERGRIARELHDVVAHHMSVISVQAGLAKFVFTSDPATAHSALGTISATSSEALEELRRMLRVLRSEESTGAETSVADESVTSHAPMPGLARLDEMVDRVRAGGVQVDLHIEGIPRPLAPGTELCAYRVVQEALTNVLKHAGGATARIRLAYHAHHIEVSVSNGKGQGTIQARVRSSSGHGLMGMRERAKLYGGTINIGPLKDGGFAVRLSLPTSARAAARGDNTTQ
ncbi:sensor histidine kinase [Streptomyces sp. NPDC005728]|uniref:sensor histidine kinase n=1 Tax=Streptomyces sp. NPDC005728 TaxID=3157054 RepID=UPI0033E53C6B